MKLFLAIALGLLPSLAFADTDVRERSLTILAFTSQSCAACQRDKPTLDELREQFNVREIDVDEQPQIARRYHVRPPTYVVLQDGVEVHRTGDVSALSAILIALLVWMFC